MQLTITQPGTDELAATVEWSVKPRNRIPAVLSLRGDTLVFCVPAVEGRFVCVRTPDGEGLRGQWSQPGSRAPLALHLSPGLATPAAAQDKAAPASATTYHTEPVTLTSPAGNVRLAGILSVPDGRGPFPGALLLSDMGSHDRDARQGNYRLFAELAAFLASHGIAVLQLDDRGVGESTGNGSATTTADLVHDAQAGLSYLRVQPTVDPARTGLIGHGEGGNVALLAAAQPAPPGFVVTLAAAGVTGFDLLAHQAEPATPADTAQAGAARRQRWADVLDQVVKLRAKGSNAAQVETYVAQQRLKIKSEERKQAEATLEFRRTMLEIVRQTTNDDQAQAIVLNMLRQRHPGLDPTLARQRATQLTMPWCRYYLTFDPRPGLARVQCPVLLLHGTDDADVSVATNLPALEKGLRANKRVTAHRLPGINHWFQAAAAERGAEKEGAVTASPLVLSTITDWILLEAGR
ncbi:alpha/beta hydrolase [Hymenobacter sp. BT664]|uniref:Alpha/beta hydrolase n=1 Tax=Hymenobacter montanus TaxID=2771359 RepID=A0A927BFA1_9BACT|nr:alpha/beta hydrolase [Hymenobacter montanus]MBD2768883.1 alpha/beta hydrolase [Hymenobacter montanus]